MQGGGQPSESNAQGQPQQGSGDPQASERTPEAPGKEKPGEQGEPKGKDQPSASDGGDPKSPRESKDDPRNEKGGPPPALDTSRAQQDRTNDQWGDLPEKYRDMFRTEGGSDLPPEYRDWIDAYYRRLNRDRR